MKIGAVLSVWRSFSLFSLVFLFLHRYFCLLLFISLLFIPCSLSVCFPSLISLSLPVCLSPLFFLSRSLSERGCGIAEVGVVRGQREIFFIWVLLSELAHHLGYTYICTYTHTHTHTHKYTCKTSNTRQMLTNNSESLAENKKTLKLGPTVHNSHGELCFINQTLADQEQNSKWKNINKTIMAQTSETDFMLACDLNESHIPRCALSRRIVGFWLIANVLMQRKMRKMVMTAHSDVYRLS